MASLDYTVVYRGGMRGYGLKYLIIEVEQADADDTVEVDEFSNAVKDTVGLETDSGAEVSCTESGTTVTIDSGGALSDKPVTILVSGY